MTDVERRRSRFAWPDRTEPTTTPAGTHDHKQSNGPLLIAFFCIVVLLLADAGLVWFIIARGEARDEAELRLRQEIRAGQCELLDALPADPLLDQVREEFGCGPGRPVESYPPEVQEQLGNAAPTTPPPPSGVETAPPGETFPLPPGADADTPRTTPYFPPEGGAADPGAPDLPPAYPAEPGPVVDLSPVTELADDLLCPLICLGGNP